MSDIKVVGYLLDCTISCMLDVQTTKNRLLLRETTSLVIEEMVEISEANDLVYELLDSLGKLSLFQALTRRRSKYFQKIRQTHIERVKSIYSNCLFVAWLTPKQSLRHVNVLRYVSSLHNIASIYADPVILSRRDFSFFNSRSNFKSMVSLVFCSFFWWAFLLSRLLVHHGVGSECKSTTEEDDGVKADTSRGTVGGGSGWAGLCVALGLWVTLLYHSSAKLVFE